MACYQLSRFFFCQAGMKQIEHSDTTVHPDLESSASSELAHKSQKLRTLRKKLMNGALLVLSVAFFITIYVLANRSKHTNNDAGELVPAATNGSLEVEVLDAAGSMRAAQQMTNLLRAQGYDVVEMKGYSGGVEDRTFIFDRSGNINAARKLAALLGVPQDKVFQKIDRTLYLDMTVVMGKDYSRLKAFQSYTERNTH
jgi:hypothetical protein